MKHSHAPVIEKEGETTATRRVKTSLHALVTPFTAYEARKLADVFSRHHSNYYCEVDSSLSTEVCNQIFVPDERYDFHLQISTETAYGLNFSEQVARHLAEQMRYSSAARTNLHIALHEAVANAIIRGNLRIASAINHIDQLEAFYKLVNNRLQDDDFRLLPIEVKARWNKKALEITVQDQGRGFDYEPVLSRLKSQPSKQVNGISLIAASSTSFHYDNGGRSLTMHFD